jgi:hypothetical protein
LTFTEVISAVFISRQLSNIFHCFDFTFFLLRILKVARMPEVLTSDGPMAAEEPDFTMFENKTGLAEDLKFLASIPEL